MRQIERFRNYGALAYQCAETHISFYHRDSGAAARRIMVVEGAPLERLEAVEAMIKETEAARVPVAGVVPYDRIELRDGRGVLYGAVTLRGEESPVDVPVWGHNWQSVRYTDRGDIMEMSCGNIFYGIQYLIP